MLKRYSNIVIIVVLLVGLFPVSVYAEPQPYISGNSISISTTNGDIKVTPHTLTASGWVTVEFQSRSITGDIDVGFGFNGYDQVQTIKSESYQNYEHLLTREVDAVLTGVYKPTKVKNVRATSKSANIGTEYLNNNKSEVDVDETDPTTGVTKQVTKTVAYDSYNSSTGEFTYKYNGKKTEYYISTYPDWKQNNNYKNIEYVNYKGSNKWETVKHDQQIVQYTWYTARFWVEVPFRGKQEVSGKYNVSVKPSSLSLVNAIYQDKAIVLDPWYNSSWGRRQSISINGSNTTKTSFPLMLDIRAGSGSSSANITYLAYHNKADFSDIRFTKSDGTTLLDYWIESYTSNSQAIVWVEFDTITANTTNAFYMYYSNSGASDAGNIQNTFDFGDDFNDASLDTATRWEVTENGGSYSESGGTLTVTAGAGVADETISSKTANYGSGYAMRTRMKRNATTGYPGAGFVTTKGSDSALLYTSVFRAATGDANFSWLSADGTNFEIKDSSLAQDSNYRTWEVKRTQGTDDVFNYNDGSTVTGQYDTTTSRYVTITAIQSSSSMVVDWILVRKYSVAPPTWGTWGGEEIPTSAGTVTTLAALSVEETTATTGGNITSVGTVGTGYGYIQAWGTQYGTATGTYTANVTNTGNVTSAPSAYYDNLSSLTEATKYFYRAFVYSPPGYGYGSELTFLTKPNPPTGVTGTPNNGSANITWAKATGGAGITIYTVVRYSSVAYPSNPDSSGTLAYNGTAESNTTYGLVNGTTYLFSLWTLAYNADPLSHYSSTYAQVAVTPIGTPTVYTSYFTGLGRDYAIVNGNVTSFAGATTVSQYGFEYGLTTAYGTDSLISNGITYPQTFYKNMTGLLPATVYHYRAKAYNGTWGYGGDMVFSTKGSPVIYENYGAGDDVYGNSTYGANVVYQTFTTNTTQAHSVTSIKLYMGRQGTPGNIVVSIRHTSGGVPTGDDLISVTASANAFNTAYTWETFTPSTEYFLEANTMYAIVVKANSGDAASYIRWRADDGGGIGGGNAGYSNNGGVSWTGYVSDYLFEIWGNPALELVNAKVFRSYLSSNDWLVVCSYKNKFPPYYTDDTSNEKDVSALFNLQLLTPTNSIIASTKVAQWAYEPGSIYLSSTQISPLTWGSAYRVRIQGNFGALPYSEYELQQSDWIGSDLTKLDSYCLSLATLMESYYSTTAVPVTLTTYVAGTGKLLNKSGGVQFDTGVPKLSTVRPNIFSVATAKGMPNTGQTWTNALQNQFVWQTQLGPELTTTLTAVGNVINVDGKIAGMIVCFILYLLIAAATFPRGHVVAGLVLSFPILLAGAWTGVIDLAVVGVVTFLMIALLMFYLWWRNAY